MCTLIHPDLPAHPSPRCAGRCRRVRQALGRAWSAAAASERRARAALDDGLLRDIGLTRADVDRESIAPFWQPLDYETLDAARHRSGPRLGASKPDRR